MKFKILAMATGIYLSQGAHAACPITKDFLDKDNAVQNLTLNEKISCLASELPKVRDGIAFTEISNTLRSGELSAQDVRGVYETLQDELSKPNKEAYHTSFLILALAEVARVDRITPFLSKVEREKLVSIAIKALTDVENYTGFDERVGYIHQIAHAADLVLQLSLNDAIDTDSLQALSTAVQQAINPSSTHFYHYGEPDRLVRATVYLMLRESLTSDYWKLWLTDAAKPPKTTWQNAYGNNEGLAALHNTQSFFNRLLLWTSDAKNPKLKAINEQALLHLKAIR